MFVGEMISSFVELISDTTSKYITYEENNTTW